MLKVKLNIAAAALYDNSKRQTKPLQDQRQKDKFLTTATTPLQHHPIFSLELKFNRNSRRIHVR